MLVTQVAILLQTLVDDFFQLGRQIGIQSNGRNWSAIEDRLENQSRALPSEGQRSGRHLIQHSAKRKQIGAGVQFLRPHLLRRHVSEGSYSRAGTRQRVRVNLRSGKCWLVASRAFGCTDLSQPEIQNLGMTALGHEDIGGLDVPMDDARSVGGIKRVGDVNAQRQDGLDLQRLATDAVFDRHAFQILHRYKRLTSLLPDFVDGADVGMVQGGGRAGFAAKSFQSLWVFRKVIRKEFESNVAAKFGVFGLIDHTHSATTKLFDNAVVRDGLADEGIGVRHSGAILGGHLEQVNETARTAGNQGTARVPNLWRLLGGVVRRA